MTNTRKTRGKGKGSRHISVRSIRRTEPDVRKLALVLMGLMQAQAEAEAMAEHTNRKLSTKDSPEDLAGNSKQLKSEDGDER
jgi:hypothetical protein